MPDCRKSWGISSWSIAAGVVIVGAYFLLLDVAHASKLASQVGIGVALLPMGRMLVFLVPVVRK